VAAVQTKTLRNDDEEEDSEEDSFDDFSFISTDSTASSGIGSVLYLYSLANDETNN